MQRSRRIMSLALGLMLSTGLPGCATKQAARPAPTAIAVKLESTPPADLLACPVAPAAFPTDASATIPAEIRAPLIGLAAAYADTADRLRRLIRWHRPDAPC
jgi:hypothetical protein